MHLSAVRPISMLFSEDCTSRLSCVLPDYSNQGEDKTVSLLWKQNWCVMTVYFLVVWFWAVFPVNGNAAWMSFCSAWGYWARSTTWPGVIAWRVVRAISGHRAGHLRLKYTYICLKQAVNSQHSYNSFLGFASKMILKESGIQICYVIYQITYSSNL